MVSSSWRSVLFVPANSGKMIEKASTLKEDAVILDCEDSVPESEKANARELASKAKITYDWGRKLVGVRINGLDTKHFVDDLKAAVNADFIVLPKVDDSAEVLLVERLIEQMTAANGSASQSPRLLVIMESPRGLINVEAILGSSRRIAAAEFGSEDYALNMGIYGATRSTSSAIYARSRVVAAAHAFGVAPLDQAFVDLKDLEGLRASAKEAKELGFVGKAVIHPSQIDVVNEVFSPTKADVEWATKVIAAWEVAQREGRAAFRLDDKMVDVVHVKMAERILKASG